MFNFAIFPIRAKFAKTCCTQKYVLEYRPIWQDALNAESAWYY